jgi:hypothetical protein
VLRSPAFDAAVAGGVVVTAVLALSIVGRGDAGSSPRLPRTEPATTAADPLELVLVGPPRQRRPFPRFAVDP